ncbi:hypothetical protein DVH24_004060 [Malus domestica]|uniref:RNase H type-1 domain-containing protein n=1 Tax=Malus domestica TaxID=3750 RepID=A0A498K7M8_MALDO|nr:hypothetical protein DVH24_004060 [Malus domestica]
MGGVGWVARDFVGIFKGAGGVGQIPCVSSLMVEAEAMRLALLSCVEKGFESILLETDSQVLVDILMLLSSYMLLVPVMRQRTMWLLMSHVWKVVILGMVLNQSGCLILWHLM